MQIALPKITTKLQKLSDAELYQACKAAGCKIQQGIREFEAYLPEVNRRRLHRRRGYASLHEFAAKLANMSKEKVDKILRLDKNLKDKPILRALFEKGEVGYAKIEKVIYVSTPETEALWADRVQKFSKSTLELCVREERASRLGYGQQNRLEVTPGSNFQPENSTAPFLGRSTMTGTSRPWSRLTFPVKPEVELRLRQMKQRLEKSRGETLTFSEVLEALLEGKEIEPKPVKVEICPDCLARREAEREGAKEVTRYLPEAVKQVVRQRQNGCCAFPACARPPEIFHHTRRFALKKSHDPQFIVGLCKPHERLVHSGLIENEESAAREWKVRPLDKTAPWWDLKTLLDERVMQYRKAAWIG